MKASKTNHLGSHCPEQLSYRADKFMPSMYKGWGWKGFFKNKNRVFLKQDLHNQVVNMEDPKV